MSDAISGSSTKPSAQCSAAPVADTADIDTVDDGGWAWDGTGRRLFVERGGVGGDVVVNYPITICLREGESGRVKRRERDEKTICRIGRCKCKIYPRWE